MSHRAIYAENISKLYRIGLKEQRSDTLVGAIASWAKKPVSNYRRLRKLTSFSTESEDQDVLWALRDVSFEVKQGEVVGILGRNGAGKSTLLKILSRITEPTFGFAELEGRISSLLEVGTGFHPDLTGRENIYLNGTILGMTKREIDDKLEEIVEFAGVERFIDTPVKWYSSGMKVRLAFSVAAHLEPEILLIDEVLAVGDLEFQRKCLGRMDAVAKEGRTVLFVSHNIAAVEKLCERAIVLVDGRIYADAPVQEGIAAYLDLMKGDTGPQMDLTQLKRRKGMEPALIKVQLLDQSDRPISYIKAGQPIRIVLEYRQGRTVMNPSFDIAFLDRFDESILQLGTRYQVGHIQSIPAEGRVTCDVDSLPLTPGHYAVSVSFRVGKKQLDLLERVMEVDVVPSNFFGTGRMPNSRRSKCLASAKWRIPGSGNSSFYGSNDSAEDDRDQLEIAELSDLDMTSGEGAETAESKSSLREDG